MMETRLERFEMICHTHSYDLANDRTDHHEMWLKFGMLLCSFFNITRGLKACERNCSNKHDETVLHITIHHSSSVVVYIYAAL